MDPSRDRPAWYLGHLEADVERFLAVIQGNDLSTPVPSCPGWDLGRLTEHLGQIHRWARFCIEHARPPGDREATEVETYDDAHAVAWFQHGAAALVATLRAVDPDAPTWHPFRDPQVAGFWFRRQAHEAAMHRWDAEAAVGDPSPIDPELASDGIDEYLDSTIPRIVARRSISLPSGSLHVHCTDVAGEWLAWTKRRQYFLARVHEKGDAALRGPAEAILLRLWGRITDADERLDPIGDSHVLAAWLAIGGN
jgi:uncharacterized protein (TIGR03083 family)